jgi:hypothetical protein
MVKRKAQRMKLKELYGIRYIREGSLDLEYTEISFFDLNNYLHRPIEDGPALICSDGFLAYYEHGRVVNGPEGWYVRDEKGKTYI